MLVAKINFPRFYLVSIQWLSQLFGYETAIVRALPFLFFVAATISWMWLIYGRFRLEVGILTIGLLLNFIPATWPVMGAMLKQYSFDTFCALLPFLLSDRFYARALGRRSRHWQLVLIAIPCALSYTYIFALAGRVGGWLATHFLAHRAVGHALDPRAVLLLAAGPPPSRSAACGSPTCVTHWDSRSSSASGSPASRAGHPGDLQLADRFLFGWYDGRLAFVRHAAIPSAALIALKLCLALGVIRVVADSRGAGARIPSGWGEPGRRAVS